MIVPWVCTFLYRSGKSGIRIAHPPAAAGVLAMYNIKMYSSKFGTFLYYTLRKEWDSNPRYTKKRTPDFESGPFDHSGIFPFLCKSNKNKFIYKKTVL